jgi:hypothetical protein
VLGGEGVELQAVERGLVAALFAVAELVGLARRFLMDRFPFAWVGRFGAVGFSGWVRWCPWSGVDLRRSLSMCG